MLLLQAFNPYTIVATSSFYQSLHRNISNQTQNKQPADFLRCPCSFSRVLPHGFLFSPSCIEGLVNASCHFRHEERGWRMARDGQLTKLKWARILCSQKRRQEKEKDRSRFYYHSYPSSFPPRCWGSVWGKTWGNHGTLCWE